MAHFALVNPNDARCYAGVGRAHARRFPLGQAYVAAALVRAGHDVSVVDASAEALSADDVVQRVVAAAPDVVGIGGTTPLFSQMAALSRMFKDAMPGVVVVLGGPHVSALPLVSLEGSAADHVCVGEGEESAVRVAGGGALPRVLRSGPVDLDACPVPARHLYDHSRYRDTARGVDTPETTAAFSRGCPGRCAFCAAGGTRVRWRHLDNVLGELRQVQDAGIRNVFVMDDTYTTNKRRVLELSRRIVEEEVRLRIGVQLRLDQVDEEVCDALYASGVRHVGPGIESGSERVLREIGKGPRETKDQIRRKMALLRKYPWTIRCSYVFGMPGETEADVLETIAFAQELGADESAFSIVTPYPGSRLWDVAVRAGKADERMDFDRFVYYHQVACNLSDVPDARLLELHELAYRETP